ncbi:hypothetical protein GF342_02180 [Candidatus Woesearchaeota archaeon]|nr:hypothetical protein [Candidatus Woesearchaeota archaeon]
MAACGPTYPDLAPQEVLDLCKPEATSSQWCFVSVAGKECGEDRDICLMKLAYEREDPSICPHVGGDVGEENCFYNVAKAKKDASLCDYTGFQASECRERCCT